MFLLWSLSVLHGGGGEDPHELGIPGTRGSLLVYKGDEADEVDALEGGRECLLAVVATASAPAAGTASRSLR